MKRLNIPRSIQVLLAMMILDFLIYLNECRYISKQKKISKEQGDENIDFSYPIQICLLKLLDGLSHLIFYLGLYFGSDVINTLANSNYEFVSLVILLRYVLTELPIRLLQLYVIDTPVGFNRISISYFIYKEFLTQLLILLVSYFFIFVFQFLSDKFIPAKPEVSLNDADNEADNTESDPSTPLQPKQIINPHNLEQFYNPTMKAFICYFFFVCITGYGMYITYKAFWLDKDTIIPPNGKMMGSLYFLQTTQGINFTNPMMRLDSLYTSRLNSYFSGPLKREIILSDNTVSFLTGHQLSTYLSVCYYRTCSQEGSLVILTFIAELIVYLLVVSYILKYDITHTFQSKDFLTFVIPMSFVYFYPYHCSFECLRSLIHKRITYNADEFAADLGYQIADTLVNLYIKNKDSVVHTHLYTLIALEEPSLQDRLVNIAVAKSKYLIEEILFVF